MNEETEALAYSQLLLLHADTITDSGVKEMVVNSAAELTILHLRVEALRRDAEALKLMRGCFDAAECEGWTAAIENGDIDRIRDLWQRRISHGLAAIDAAMGDKT